MLSLVLGKMHHALMHLCLFSLTRRWQIIGSRTYMYTSQFILGCPVDPSWVHRDIYACSLLINRSTVKEANDFMHKIYLLLINKLDQFFLTFFISLTTMESKNFQAVMKHFFFYCSSESNFRFLVTSPKQKKKLPRGTWIAIRPDRGSDPQPHFPNLKNW